jgi:hypothetical protein
MMTAYMRRTCTFLLISIALVSVDTAGAQERVSLGPQDIGEIVNEVFDALVPSSGSRAHAIWRRDVRFDHERTLAAFGERSSVAVTNLNIRHPIKPGSAALLEDCNELGTKSCKRLGQGVYSYIEPISISQSQARVRAYFISAHVTRPGGGTAPRNPHLAGSYTVVYLSRAADGSWRYVKTGDTNVF